ncbi:MAG: DUF2147 domain-containing protein [Flavobacteriales bacterium]|jgi:uncharacterized protein (DUF2147 family)|nr:DUF2147 domain-containing protein [Flavobacteriales bacterium]
MRTTLLLLTLLLLPFGTVLAQAPPEPADRLIGVWEPSNGKARVKIEKIGGKYYGKIVWLREPNDPATGTPKTDKNNPDESQRTVPLRGYRLLKDFTYGGNDEWTEGTIYDPENGSTYSCVITMKDANTLDIRGFIGVKALGRTDVWKRLQTK